MQIQRHDIDTVGVAGMVRSVVVRPLGTGRHPVLLCFADIFGNSPSHVRVMSRLAGHGFVVVSPEPWCRSLPAGTVLDFDADRDLALHCAEQAIVVAADQDLDAVIAAVRGQPYAATPMMAMGFCYGGHVAWRAALRPEVVATVCCYPTGVHNPKLGGGDADSLSRCRDIQGRLLLVWGREDPHIPAEGRSRIHAALDQASVRWEARLHDAEHAFMRDVGARFDPAATDDVIAAALALFRAAS
jgi:carboxymethylenebutenolidase